MGGTFEGCVDGRVVGASGRVEGLVSGRAAGLVLSAGFVLSILGDTPPVEGLVEGLVAGLVASRLGAPGAGLAATGLLASFVAGRVPV